jgi:hypothetical protein
MVLCFVSIYEIRRMKPVEIVLRKRGGGEDGERWRVNVRHMEGTCVNATMHPPDEVFMGGNST